MNWKLILLLLTFIFFSCKDEKRVNNPSFEDFSEKASSSYLIEVEDLLKIANTSTIKILDFRKSKFYVKEHIAGALNIWRTDIEDTSYPYNGMMASKKQIEILFSKLGISNSDTIIIYDDNGLCDSSRLWWILQNYDFTNVKLLHGGINEWKRKNGAISIAVPVPDKTVFRLPENPSMKYFVAKDVMLQAITNNTIILDTRTDDEFSGKRQKKGAANGGRIPKSKLIDWAVAVDYYGDNKIKSIDELTEIYGQIASKEDTIIAYCHSGVRSAHTTFVLTQLLGYKHVKNYDGSWTEWSHFNDLPIEKDSITTIID